jgi:transcriptional regulator with XRE-family HTH domain
LLPAPSFAVFQKFYHLVFRNGMSVDYCVIMTQNILGLGRRIADFRKREGLSAQELALDAGMSRSVIANIENGRRDDITVSELLSISRVLRVPPVAILFDVTRPMAPTSSPNESEDDEILRPRTIDIVDWVAGLDGPAQWSESRTLMEEDLARNGPAVMPPMGLVVEATYGESGWDAIRLLTVGRQLRSATEHYAELTREFAQDVRFGTFGWEPELDEHLGIMEAVQSIPESAAIRQLDAFLEKVKVADPAKHKDAERAVRRLKQAEHEVRNLTGLLKSLGGTANARAASDEEFSFPSFGFENVVMLWERTKFKYMRDLVEGDFVASKYRTADKIYRGLKSGKLTKKLEKE